jgi:hypothetical protein
MTFRNNPKRTGLERGESGVRVRTSHPAVSDFRREIYVDHVRVLRRRIEIAERRTKDHTLWNETHTETVANSRQHILLAGTRILPELVHKCFEIERANRGVKRTKNTSMRPPTCQTITCMTISTLHAKGSAPPTVPGPAKKKRRRRGTGTRMLNATRGTRNKNRGGVNVK